ncbi:chorismate synthase [bacterium 1XD42-8]|jgi:chorismate synthase|nr:chorismate synthase [Lachnospiraceae bacterium]RKJ46292.1 chorismate synthase [bacterium 1XD42-8]
MAGSSFGNQFKITTWGESHGKAIGVVVDGCPAGLPLTEKDIQSFLDRRKPGSSPFVTPRKEKDEVEILSGTFDGRTTGCPISLLVRNLTHRSSDYNHIADIYRPGHGDYTFDHKYGFRDYRGGGRTSGRETIGRVAAGSIASKLLEKLGIDLYAYTKSIGPVSIDPTCFSREEIQNNPLFMPDSASAAKAEEYLTDCMKQQDSSGGVIECIAKNLPIGIGEPVFDKLSANLAKAICSIGSVKAFEIGDGIEVSKARGSQNNDCFFLEKGNIAKKTNHSGGILGGLSDGSDLILRAHIKPTSSISAPQTTVSRNGKEEEIRIQGRHDPVIVPRAVVVVESMTAITLIDMLFSNMTAKIDGILKFYER